MDKIYGTKQLSIAYARYKGLEKIDSPLNAFDEFWKFIGIAPNYKDASPVSESELRVSEGVYCRIEILLSPNYEALYKVRKIKERAKELDTSYKRERRRRAKVSFIAKLKYTETITNRRKVQVKIFEHTETGEFYRYDAIADRYVKWKSE